MRTRGLLAAAGCAAMALAALPGASGAGTLDLVRERGELACAMSGRVPGFSFPDDGGVMRGLDADTCRAVAAAVFGDASKVRFVSITTKERFDVLASGDADMLSHTATHTLTRDASLGLNFTHYNFIDGQAFMVRRALGVDSAHGLDGARVCVQTGTTTEANLADFFRENGMSYEQVAYETAPDTREGFESGYCDALTTDASGLASIRTELDDPSSVIILPEVISKEPLGPVVRQGDDEFLNLVRWVLYAMINAEELGVTSDNVDSMRSDAGATPEVRRLVGTEGSMCRLISESLDDGCFADVIAQVGNYGEVYEASLGEDTPLGIRREGTPNALWSKGGILYAPPLR